MAVGSGFRPWFWTSPIGIEGGRLALCLNPPFQFLRRYRHDVFHYGGKPRPGFRPFDQFGGVFHGFYHLTVFSKSQGFCESPKFCQTGFS
jgi:hypothetical protein